MALPVFRSQGSFASGSGAISPGIPPGIQANDILVMIIVTPFGASAPGVDWTLRYTDVTGPRVSVYWKRTNGTEGTVTVSDTGLQQTARIFAYSGCITTGDPFDAGVEQEVTFDDTAVSITLPGDTTTSADVLNLLITATYASIDTDTEDPFDITINSPDWTNGDLANLGQVSDAGTLYILSRSAYYVRHALTSGEKAVAGAFGSSTADPYWAGTFASFTGTAVVLGLIGTAPSYAMDADPMALTIAMGDISFSAAGSAGSLDIDPMAVSIAMTDVQMVHGGGGIAQIDTWQWDTPEVDADFVPIDWYVAHQYSDGGAENRSKRISAVRITGKTTDGEIQIHGAPPGAVISRDNIEEGTNALATFPITDATDVTRHDRVKMRVRNMSQTTVRISGSWDGENGRDRLDEIAIEGDITGTVK